MLELLQTVAALLAWITFIAGVPLIGKWILGPIDAAARARQAPIRYSIADFLCLFVIIQIPLAAAFQFSDEEAREYYWLFTAVTWIAAPVIWVTATRALSKAGISGGVHRLIFMGVIIPLAYYGLIPFVVMPSIGLSQIIKGTNILTQHGWLVALWFVLGILLYLSGRYTKWMVAEVN
jgi:hypothetical protein